MKLSRSRESLDSVVRSNVIFEFGENVPSEFRVNVPVPPVAVSTASLGSETPTSCSRTLTTAFDAAPTVQVFALAAAVDAAVAAGVVVAAAVAAGVELVVGAGVAVATAPPPHAAKSRAAAKRRVIGLVMDPPFVVRAQRARRERGKGESGLRSPLARSTS